MKEIRLTCGQQKLVEQNLQVVSKAIRRYIFINETWFGFEYDDVYQEGCIWLCKAAASFRPEMQVPFAAYAEKVVANGLRTYCRLMRGKQTKVHILSLYTESDNSRILFEKIPVCDHQDNVIAEADTMRLLQRMKRQYTGTVRLGIEAIELKTKGYSGQEIAAMYGVKPNLVGAWISRAKSKLKQNEMFMDYFYYPVEKAS